MPILPSPNPFFRVHPSYSKVRRQEEWLQTIEGVEAEVGAGMDVLSGDKVLFDAVLLCLPGGLPVCVLVHDDRRGPTVLHPAAPLPGRCSALHTSPVRLAVYGLPAREMGENKLITGLCM